MFRSDRPLTASEKRWRKGLMLFTWAGALYLAYLVGSSMPPEWMHEDITLRMGEKARLIDRAARSSTAVQEASGGAFAGTSIQHFDDNCGIMHTLDMNGKYLRIFAVDYRSDEDIVFRDIGTRGVDQSALLGTNCRELYFR